MDETKHIVGLANMPAKIKGCVLTIGNFDGVHRGHRRLLSKAWTLAGLENAPLVAMTFNPPSEIVMHPDHCHLRLNTHAQRVQRLIDNGADYVVTVETNKEFLHRSPEDFVQHVILDTLGAKHVIEGPNFFFGRKRAGNVELLTQFGQQWGFGVHVVETLKVELDGRPTRISSTLIRGLVRQGRVDVAADLLTQPFELIGPIVGGEQVGRALEYPTANLDAGQQIIPADGVYAGVGFIDGQRYAAAISIGTKPTFGEKPRTIEANLLDASGDFYGRPLQLRFLKRLRDQIRFADVAELKQQIHDDVTRVREIVNE